MRCSAPELHGRVREWLEDARKNSGLQEPWAMTLATCDAEGKPSARVVLLKHYDERGFVFFTHIQSRKSLELAANAQAALCFYWPALKRQLRVEGVAQMVSAAEADAYFSSRPRESQLGAWASLQSRTLETRETLEARFQEHAERFKNKPVPRPDNWSGWRVEPRVIECWEEAPFRLHAREQFTRVDGTGWERVLLYP